MSALVFDLADWTQIELTGRDRQSFLNGFVTNDVKKLQPGEGCEVFLSNIKGRVIGHVWVFAKDDRLSLEGEPGQADTILQHLDKYLIAEDVQITNRTQDWELLLIAGDDTASILEKVGLTQSPPAAPGDHLEVGWEGATISIRRADLVADSNWTISAPSELIDELRSRLRSAGAEVSEHDTFESLRVAHGYPLVGVDLTDENLVHESARVRQTVSFTKGCYLGQEPIARLDSLGHVNRHLCRLLLETAMPPSAGAKVLQASDGERKQVGHITSSAPWPPGISPQSSVAIALIKRESATAGASLLVEMGDSVAPAMVAPRQ